jgi:hypothetical protein
MAATIQTEPNVAGMARKWICEVSAERVGNVWREEDHEALMRTLRAADNLTEALILIARREAKESAEAANEYRPCGA